MSPPTVLLGAGAQAREMIAWAKHLGRPIAGCFAPAEKATTVGGLPVFRSAAEVPAGAQWTVAVGSPRLARTLAEQLGSRFAPAAPFLHPTCVIGERVQIGAGSAFTPYTALSCDIEVGQGVLMNPFTAVGHDSFLGDFCSLAIGVAISGGVRLEPGVQMGSGSVVLPGVKVGRGVIVGAGAVVRDDAAPGVYAGVPARRIRDLASDEHF